MSEAMKCVLKLAGNAMEIVAFNGEAFQIVAYTDKSAAVWDTEIGGKPVWSVFKVVEKYQDKKIDKVLVSSKVPDSLMSVMVTELTELGMDADDILVILPEFFKTREEKNICEYRDFHRMHYLEFHVADHCNLRCKGCSHFSPLVEGKVFADFEEVKKDFQRLRQIVQYIDHIHILGGEPFLNKELYRYIDMVREIYPFSDIQVVTNGLLLDRVSEELMETFKEHNAGILVSVYPPMRNSINDIVVRLRENGIKINCLGTIHDFAYVFDNKAGHAVTARRNNCPCANLHEGYLTPCPQIAYGDYFNQYFGENMDFADGRIDIYDEQFDYTKLRLELKQVRKVCDRCFRISREHILNKKWLTTKKPAYDDYVYVER